MFNVTLDLGDTPSVLRRLSNPAIAQAVANAAAESYTDDTLDWIAAGRSFRTRAMSGGENTEIGLEQSIGWHGNGNGSATVYANKDYARYVEEGTQPHVIRPKAGRKALKITLAGSGFIFRKFVNHPGTTAKPFFFADSVLRSQHMQDRALSVLARYANG